MTITFAIVWGFESRWCVILLIEPNSTNIQCNKVAAGFTQPQCHLFSDCDKPRHARDAAVHRLRVPSLDVGARRPASHLQTGQGLKNRPDRLKNQQKEPTAAAQNRVIGEKNIQIRREVQDYESALTNSDQLLPGVTSCCYVWPAEAVWASLRTHLWITCWLKEGRICISVVQLAAECVRWSGELNNRKRADTTDRETKERYLYCFIISFGVTVSVIHDKSLP